VKVGVVVAEVDGEPLKLNWPTKVKAEVVIAEVDGEPLNLNHVDKGEG
jgi:hypothetical protein